jgi:hypothetical protein
MAPTQHPAVHAGSAAGQAEAARGTLRLHSLVGSVTLLRIARNAAIEWGAADGPFVGSPAFSLYVEAFLSSYRSRQLATAMAA